MNIRKIAVVGGFDRILTADVAAAAPKTTVPGDVTPLEYELYGVAPITAGVSSDSGSYDLFNGTLGEFDDAYNVELYALENGGALVPAADIGNIDLITTSATSAALATDSVSGAFTTYIDPGLADLSGFFDIPSL
jgi:hypothetical protein